MQSRRTFISNGLLATGSVLFAFAKPGQADRLFITVRGNKLSTDLGMTLTHEHTLVDFIGADKVSPSRYDPAEVQKIVLPYLKELKKLKCKTFIDCTPAYIGRDVKILKQLSESSGLDIITNTGYYGAAKEKYLPSHAYTETAEQLSQRWIKESKDGIEGTGIKPGFIKTGVDAAPLSEVQEKLIKAAALTHLATGLTIAVHTGDGKAALRQLEILEQNGVSPMAWIWVHAQNEKDLEIHIKVARKGGWIEFDGVGPSSLSENIGFLSRMKKEGILDHVLVSQDAGWYHVGEPNGGEFRNFNFVFTHFIPELVKEGFSQNEINQIFIANPTEAFCIGANPLG